MAALEHGYAAAGGPLEPIARNPPDPFIQALRNSMDHPTKMAPPRRLREWAATAPFDGEVFQVPPDQEQAVAAAGARYCIIRAAWWMP